MRRGEFPRDIGFRLFIAAADAMEITWHPGEIARNSVVHGQAIDPVDGGHTCIPDRLRPVLSKAADKGMQSLIGNGGQ
ncbi:MAG TPA: hypothetical protein VHV47_11635, partial [Opitutaceae bacterium]|nr:hypothetical protein [Opitutaceae bacterium]